MIKMFVNYNKDTGMSWSSKKLGKCPMGFPTIINMGTMEMIACLWIILALSSVALSQTNFYTHGRYGKRQESHAPDALPFFSGSRYGRSGDDVGIVGISSSTNEKSSDKSFEILPRVDRFFLGSRYGKRGLMSNETLNNIERSMINIQSLDAVLSYIYRLRHANNHRLIIGNNNNNNNNDDNNRDYHEEVKKNYNDQHYSEKIDT